MNSFCLHSHLEATAKHDEICLATENLNEVEHKVTQAQTHMHQHL